MQGLVNDQDPEIRGSAAHLITLVSGGDLTGGAGEAVLQLLMDGEPGFRRTVLRGMEGASYSAELEARVIALSTAEHRQQRQEAVHFALSTQANKSEASVKRLIELLDEGDLVNIASRAAWGLQRGVPQSMEPRIADKGMDLLTKGKSEQEQLIGMQLLAAYANAGHKGQIERMAQDPELKPKFRMGLDKIYQQLGGGS